MAGLGSGARLGPGLRRLGRGRSCLQGGGAKACGRPRAARRGRALDAASQHVDAPRRPGRHPALDQAEPPKPEDLAVRERVLGWAAAMADDRDWFIQKAIAWWVRDLSKHDPERARAFLAAEGLRLKPFARKEAARHLGRAPEGRGRGTRHGEAIGPPPTGAAPGAMIPCPARSCDFGTACPGQRHA